MAYAVRASIREGGVTYRSPDEAYAAAAIIEDEAEQRAAQYRRNGDDGLADTTVDNGHAKAERLRTWARQREEFEAHETTQPSNVPDEPVAPSRRKAPPSGSPSRRGDTTRPARRVQARRAGSAFGGRTGGYARHGYRRSGAQAAVTSATGLGWWIAGATIGVALLTIFLTPRGTAAFGGLSQLAAGALKLVVDPIDPLAPGQLDAIAAPVGARAPAPNARSRPPANRRPVGGLV